ncbi:MAG: hypothetical protein ACPGU0_04070, partial [Marinirhabdus sp.]
KENIIGYTGDIHDNPTVFFKKGNKFGRITQDHQHEDNIGRNRVKSHSDHSIENRDGRAHEYYNGQERYNSHHQFIAVDQHSADLDTLTEAANRYRGLKPKYRW